MAARLSDPKGAKACGFYTSYVGGLLKVTNPDLRGEHILDIRMREGKGGVLTLAASLSMRFDCKSMKRIVQWE